MVIKLATNSNNLSSIEEALKDFSEGKMLIVIDDEDRENEGDLVVAGEFCTPQIMNFMIRNGGGVPFIPTTAKRFEELGIRMMTSVNTARHSTAMGETVDALNGTLSGVSAQDRTATVWAFVNENTKPSDLAHPGHVIPICAQTGGVLKRAGHTEAIVDLCILSGLKPVGLGCEILNEDGTMARLPQLIEFSKKHNIKIISIADMIAFRKSKEKMVKRVSTTTLPTEFGIFTAVTYQSELDGTANVALVKGPLELLADSNNPPLVRVHSSCVTGDIFHSLRCDCGKQLEQALKLISESKSGVLLYIQQEGRGIGLVNKMRAYELQEKEGLDTVEANIKLGFPADLRDYGVGASILSDLKITKMKLLTNNPRKIVGLNGHGLDVVQRVPISIEPVKENSKYLKTKKEKLGHLI